MNNKRCYYHLGNSKVLGSCGPGTRDKDQMYFFITPFSLHLPPNVFLITPHTESEPLGVGPSSPCPNNFSRRLRGTLKFVYHCSVIFFFFASSGAYYCKFATSQRAAGKSGSIRKPFQREEITEEIKH